MKVKIERTGDWKVAFKVVGEIPAAVREALPKALLKEGHFIAGKVKEKMNAGPFSPLSPLTLLARRLNGIKGTKPLLASLALRDAMTAVQTGPLKVQVGIMKGERKRGAGGRYVASNTILIASVMEEGATIVLKVTKKMRKFLFGVLLKDQPKRASKARGPAAGKVIIIRIPPRPFIRPTYDAWAPTSGERVYANLAELMGGRLGKP